MREEDRVVRLLTLASFGGSFGAGGSLSSLRHARLRSSTLRVHPGTGLDVPRVTARKRRKRGFFGRLHLDKLARLAAHFTPVGGLLT